MIDIDSKELLQEIITNLAPILYAIKILKTLKATQNLAKFIALYIPSFQKSLQSAHQGLLAFCPLACAALLSAYQARLV